MKKIIWLPRVITIAFIVLLLLFSFDVFEMEGSLLTKLAAFIMHSLPSMGMALILVVFWKKPQISGFCFLVVAVIFTIVFRTYMGIISFIIVSCIPVLIGILFLWANSKTKKY